MIDDKKSLFHNNEEKLNYIIKKLNLKTKDIAEKLEISTGLVSQIQNHYNGKLRKIHLYAICHAYNIPLEIFENQHINNIKSIDTLMEHASNNNSIFDNNHEILNKLVGTWYLYSYPSNSNLSEVWITETHIYDDLRVEDIHKNAGQVYIGKKQSIIIKESHNSKNITSITFDNDRITYGFFPFSRVSKSNSLNRELFNFGFFSKRKIEKKEAIDILGKLESVQLQMNYEMLERINSHIIMRG